MFILKKFYILQIKRFKLHVVPHFHTILLLLALAGRKFSMISPPHTKGLSNACYQLITDLELELSTISLIE